jgi:hypothetical protein
VGETAFHVCFLMGTAVHLHLAKRMLKFYPLLLNDIYLSDEYYGENVLHMSCVAEDPSVVKWLLDIGADFNRFTRKGTFVFFSFLWNRFGPSFPAALRDVWILTQSAAVASTGATHPSRDSIF